MEYLQACLQFIRKENPWYGSVLQSTDIYFTELIQTMGVKLNSDFKKFELLISPTFVNNLANNTERAAVLLHECLHIVHGHLISDKVHNATPEQLKMMNIAMDLAINQYITGLPKTALTLEMFPKYNFEKFREWDYYYNKLVKNPENMPKGASTIDEHMFSDSKEGLEATRSIITRANNLAGYSNTPDFVKDLLQQIDAKLAALNYKQIILSAMRRSLPSNDRKRSWCRNSRRHGNLAPGMITAQYPKIEFHIDTSGSIGYDTLCEFLKIVNEFLRVGANKCSLNLFHTNVYYKKDFKKNMKLEESMLQCGGTSLKESLAQIQKNKPELAVILTDGHYDHVVTKNMPQTIFIITKDGTIDHPFKNEKWCKTIRAL